MNASGTNRTSRCNSPSSLASKTHRSTLQDLDPSLGQSKIACKNSIQKNIAYMLSWKVSIYSYQHGNLSVLKMTRLSAQLVDPVNWNHPSLDCSTSIFSGLLNYPNWVVSKVGERNRIRQCLNVIMLVKTHAICTSRNRESPVLDLVILVPSLGNSYRTWYNNVCIYVIHIYIYIYMCVYIHI